MPIKDIFKSLSKNASVIKSWFYEPKWLNRIAHYLILFALVYIIFKSIFSYFGFLHTDIDSARYMLSALIQGEFTVLAIVVSFSIVASQLAAQSYSARVIEVFRKNPDLKIIGMIYVLAIFYGLGVLKLLEKANPELCAQKFICQSTLEVHIAFSYYLAIFAATAMVPYIRNTVKLLKPSTIINMLAKEVTMDNILSSIGNDHKKSDDENPILPVIDIVRRSLIRYDYETVREVLRAIRGRVNTIFETETFKAKRINTKYLLKSETTEGEVKYFYDIDLAKKFDNFFAQLARLGKLSASKKDEDSTKEVIITLCDNGITAAKQGLEEATWHAADALREIGKASAEQKLSYATFLAIEALEKIGIVSATELKFIMITWNTEMYIKEIRDVADKQELDEYCLKKINEALTELDKFTVE